MKTRVFYQFAFVLSLLINSCNSDCNKEITSEDISNIKNEITKYETIIRNNELDRLDSIFTDDIVFIRPNNDNIVGIDNLLQIHYSGLLAVPGFWKSTAEIHGYGNVAYAFGSYGFSKGEQSGKYLEIRKKQPDGSWPISRLIWNENRPKHK
jgi:ketosteroid isomerase-like protein